MGVVRFGLVGVMCLGLPAMAQMVPLQPKPQSSTTVTGDGNVVNSGTNNAISTGSNNNVVNLGGATASGDISVSIGNYDEAVAKEAQAFHSTLISQCGAARGAFQNPIYNPMDMAAANDMMKISYLMSGSSPDLVKYYGEANGRELGRLSDNVSADYAAWISSSTGYVDPNALSAGPSPVGSTLASPPTLTDAQITQIVDQTVAQMSDAELSAMTGKELMDLRATIRADVLESQSQMQEFAATSNQGAAMREQMFKNQTDARNAQLVPNMTAKHSQFKASLAAMCSTLGAEGY